MSGAKNDVRIMGLLARLAAANPEDLQAASDRTSERLLSIITGCLGRWHAFVFAGDDESCPVIGHASGNSADEVERLATKTYNLELTGAL